MHSMARLESSPLCVEADAARGRSAAASCKLQAHMRSVESREPPAYTLLYGCKHDYASKAKLAAPAAPRSPRTLQA